MRAVQYHLYVLRKCGLKTEMWIQRFNPVFLTSQEVEIKRITVTDQTQPKAQETPSQPIAGHGGVCLLSQLQQGSTNRKTTIQASQGRKRDPISKITNAKEG
jgi:hypothetical protein